MVCDELDHELGGKLEAEERAVDWGENHKWRTTHILQNYWYTGEICLILKRISSSGGIVLIRQGRDMLHYILPTL